MRAPTDRSPVDRCAHGPPDNPRLMSSGFSPACGCSLSAKATRCPRASHLPVRTGRRSSRSRQTCDRAPCRAPHSVASSPASGTASKRPVPGLQGHRTKLGTTRVLTCPAHYLERILACEILVIPREPIGRLDTLGVVGTVKHHGSCRNNRRKCAEDPRRRLERERHILRTRRQLIEFCHRTGRENRP